MKAKQINLPGQEFSTLFLLPVNNSCIKSWSTGARGEGNRAKKLLFFSVSSKCMLYVYEHLKHNGTVL